MAPVALFNLLPDAQRPDRIFAICTPEAKSDSWPLLERELGGRCKVGRIDVGGGESSDDVAAFLSNVSSSVADDVELTVDVTHGFRHFSFLTYIAVLYLNALRSVRVRGAYYGLLKQDRPSPFLDLRPLLSLPNWIHALRVLSETGSAIPMANLLTGPKARDPLVHGLSNLSEALLSGLPIELGMQAHKVRNEHLKALKRALAGDHALPLSTEVAQRFDETVAHFSLTDPPSGDGWKKRIALSEEELDRQGRLIDYLLERKNLAAALGLMNEWTVSWAVLRQGRREDWLCYQRVRRKVAGRLDAIKAVGEDSELKNCLTAEQRDFGKYWGHLKELRNAYHHHGMRPQPLVGAKDTKQRFDRVREYWRQTLCCRPEIPLSLGFSTGGRILISPFGKRPGVLFSALHACRTEGGGLPTSCLVICSRESENRIEEAVSKVGNSVAIERLCFDDPYGGLAEIELLEKASRARLVGAEQVLINVTGGTTLMGLAAEKLGNAAHKLACPMVRRFGLVDKRPPAEQDAEPFVVGEPFWLDRAESDYAD